MATAAGARAHLHDEETLAAASSIESQALEAFAHSLLVLDADGRVIWRNSQASRLIESTGLADTQLGCCALLGCRRADTVLAGGCVTELALAGEEPLPELRVDIDTAEDPLAVWVAAARLAGQERRVVLQLRPGVTHDRRARTLSHWIRGPRLRITTLGATVVEAAEGPIAGDWLEQRAGQLLKYLATERRRALAVDEIAESIWPGAEYAVGASVRYHIHTLRRRLEPLRGPREPSAFITARSGTYRLALENVTVDADEFEVHIRAGLAAADDDPQAAVLQLELGLACYRGEFLAELPYAEWAIPERHRLHDLACGGLDALADLHMGQGRVEAAGGCLERLASLQPFDEDVHRRLMELDISRGRRSDAVRRYETLRTRIRRTFGHDPNFTPADLHGRTP
jgi:DNA-binding SARP family transcriptional activator